ncbi:MAG: pantetheine-phosphate adenylyltransferase [Betaproteobacteria bacterium]|jgi:pantetheine-phosphate adenylyltransferase|nr:pantetheine-phosphate adenylyltransferase [Betaproteobacteria bacterium]
MPAQVIALYPGTFDPITLGHEDIVRRAARMFDQVVVAVASAHHKKTMFTLEERLSLTREALHDCTNVQIKTFDGLVIDFAASLGATTMVRGIRSMTDFDYEFQLAGMNRRLAPKIDTVFLNTLDVYQCISSTLVREVNNLGGDVTQFVSPSVLRFMQAKKAA